MRNVEFTLFDFNDLLIEPAHISNISSRKEINPKYYSTSYPIMTAPMDTVINEENSDLFKINGITPILPRISNPGLDYISSKRFLSYSLTDFNRIFLENTPVCHPQQKNLVLIDVANGHMRALYDSAKTAKEKYGDKMVLMVGNVANPKTFAEYCMIDVDYIRVGIGNGGGCLTTVQTGVGFPMASLIEECYDVKKYMNYPNTKIVADGGFKSYSDIIKALALGADYVMLGSIFNKCLESAGETTKENGEIIDQYSMESMDMYNADIPLYKNFRGMSTKEVQKKWGRKNIKTSEGVHRVNKVEYKLDTWVDNFKDYLKSAMSYTNSKNLNSFRYSEFVKITENAYKRFNK